MLWTTTILATLLPVAYYIYVGLRRDSRPESLEDYFIYGRKVSAKDFANTAIGYSLQMAAIFLFIDWGLRYGFGAFWVPLFWGIGFFFFYLSIPRLSRFLSGTWTLHGYLKTVSGSRSLQVIAAIATVIGLWGTMMVEVDYATSVYQPFFSSQKALFIFGIVFLSFGFVYITYGGYRAEVNTERVQVPIAYTTFIVVMLLVVFAVFWRGYYREYWILNGLLFIHFVLMIFAKIGIVPGRPFADRQIVIPIVALVVQTTLLLVSTRFSPAEPSPPLSPLLSEASSQIKAQGVLTLISLFCANALWQFVDISNWQRVSSVRIDDDSANRYAALRRGVWRVMIESPVTWGFGVVFGIALRYAGFLKPQDDPAVAVSNFVTALVSDPTAIPFLGSYSWVLYPIFVAAVVAIMLSTVTALISAITFTAFHDLPPYAAKPSLGKARAYAIGITVVGAFAYFGLRHIFGIGIQSALYTFYSSQIALFPTVFASMFCKRALPAAAVASILVGIIVTFVSASVIAKYSPDLALVPPLFTLIVSSIVYVLVVALRNKSGQAAEETIR